MTFKMKAKHQLHHIYHRIKNYMCTTGNLPNQYIKKNNKKTQNYLLHHNQQINDEIKQLN